MKNLPLENYLLEVVGYSPSCYLLICCGVFKVCEPGRLCSKPWNSYGCQLLPQLPNPVLLLLEKASLLALESAPQHCSDSHSATYLPSLAHLNCC